MFYWYKKPTSGGASNYMQDIVSSACCDLDATIDASYGGSGETFSNLIPTPADSESQTSWDAWLGGSGTTDGDEPTFNGSAGDSGAYFSVDGSDTFEFKTATDLQNNMIKDNAKFWIACAFQPAAISTSYRLFGSGTTANGIDLIFQSTTRVRVRAYQDSGLNGALDFNPLSLTLSGGTDYLFILSFDEATGNGILWINGTKHTASVTYTTPTATNPTAPLNIFSNNSTSFMPNSSRLYAFAVGNDTLSDSDESAIRAEYNTRHNKTY